MTRGRWMALVAVVAFLAAIAGVFVGRTLIPARHAQGSQLHELLHHGLKLDADQQARIEALEQRFAVRRRALEMELRADNARLADSIQAEHGNGPRVAAAVDASHVAMGKLQKETLAHVFAMRQILRPEQTAAFDRAVTKSLTADAR
ncbi:periplasmic heavy metal sensor [Sphingomonas xinjiangensis]|uniref:Spy/CpxP family protein refolding chaperone n=1 Tax=Sphingomonas xinjiangensis TaxID=643568 RepID=A0A840YSE4_9SPHN|nr:periplasmic heavy metal sensor [Sphingomonas xinjiangensis]MBB5712606.1 Spy/CpxP family protein refolding chaperone [Sphingomonas xinjiangensis]